MKKKILFYIFIFIVILFHDTNAQTDTAFWFAPTYVNPTNGNGPVFLRLANATNQPTSIRIYLPAFLAGLDTTFTLSGNGNTSINLTSRLSILTDVVPDKIKSNGIKIESQTNITAYYEVVGRTQSDPKNGITNPEIFVMKGRNALGKEFYIPNQSFWSTDNNPESDFIDGKAKTGWYDGKARATIEVVATEDGKIYITPTNPYRLFDGTVQTSLATFERELKKGQVFTIEAAYWAADKHLGGTKITSTMPIAVTDKDDTVKEGDGVLGLNNGIFDYGYDLMGDQLVPANVVGSEYLVVQGYLTSTKGSASGVNEYVFMVPTSNGTYIIADGIILPGGPFNAGQVIRYQITKPAVRIISTSDPATTLPNALKSIYVYQVTGVDNEVASAILPSTNCSGSSSVTFSRTDLPSDALDFYVNLIVKDGGENSFLIDGVPAGNLGFSAPISGWRYARIKNPVLFPAGTHTVSNSNSLFHLAIFFGKNQKGASYGYFSDFGSIKLNIGLDKFNCATDKVVYTLPSNLTSIIWTSTELTGNVSTNPLTIEKSGTYYVAVTDRYGCNIKDTVTITYAPEVKVDWVDKDRPICKESEDPARTYLTVRPNYDLYEWTRPDLSVFKGSGSLFKKLIPTVKGKYILKVTNFFGANKELACSAIDESNIDVRSNFFRFKDLSDTMEYCFGKNLIIDLDSMRTKTTYPKYNGIGWFKNDIQVTYPGIQWKTTPLTESAEYKAIIVDEDNCRVKDSVVAIFYPEMKLGWDKNKVVCKESLNNSKTTINLIGGYDTYKWTRIRDGFFINSGSIFIPTESGNYKVEVSKKFNNKTNFTCTVNDQGEIKWVDKFFKFKDLGDSATLCNTGENSLILNLDTAKNAPYFGKSIIWFRNKTNQNIIGWLNNITSGGEYKAQITDVYDCIFSDSVYVNYVDKISVSLGGDTTAACFADLPIQKSLEFVANPTGNYDYIWTTDNGIIIPKNTLKHVVEKQGRYTLEVIDKKFPACNGKGTTYAIRPLDSLNAPWDSTTKIDCEYSNLSLCGPAKLSNYTWYRNNQILPNETGNCLNKFNDSASYRLEMKQIYASNAFCKGDAEAIVKQYDKLEVGLNNGDSPFCYPHDKTAIIKAKSKYFKYEWTPNVTTDSFFIPKKEGKFSLKAYNKDGCFGEGFTNVIFVPQIKFNIAAEPKIACWYSNFEIRPGGGFGKYEWFGTDRSLGPLDSIYKPSKSGIYKVIVTTLIGNCKDSAIASIEYINQFNIDIGSDLEVCNDKRIDLNIPQGDKPYDSNAWFYNNRNNKVSSEINYSPPIPIIAPNSLSFRFVVLARAEIKTCYAYDSANVTYFRSDSVRGFDTTVCLNKEVKLDPGPGFYTYKWKYFETELTQFENDSFIRVNKPGDYRVDLTSKCGGLSRAYYLNNFKEIKLNLGDNRDFCVNEPYYILNLSDSSFNRSYLYTWRDLENKNQIITANKVDSRYDIKTNVFVSLEVIDANGCIKTDTVLIGTNDDCFMIPNLFTPGTSDNKNPTFQVRGMYPGEWSVEIYNRWGDRVYMNENYNNEWGGDNVNDGVYYYSLRNKKRGRQYKGWVQVINSN